MTFDPEALPVPDLGLLCRGCGYPLAGLSQHRCPECGRQFTLDEYIPPGDFPFLIYEGKEVRPTLDTIELLNLARIPYMHVMPPGDTVLSSMGLNPDKPRGHLSVPRDLYFQTIHLLRQRDLGKTIETPSDVDREDWKCPGCDEENPGTFDLCWSCGRARVSE